MFQALKEGVALTVSRYLDAEEKKLPPPSIRLVVTAAFSLEDINKIMTVLKDACQKVLTS